MEKPPRGYYQDQGYRSEGGLPTVDDELLLGIRNATELADMASSYLSRQIMFHSELDLSASELDQLFKLLHSVAEENSKYLFDFVLDYNSELRLSGGDLAQRSHGPVIWLLTELLKLYTEPVEDVCLCLMVLDSLVTIEDNVKFVVDCHTVGVVLGSMAAQTGVRNIQLYGGRVLSRLAKYLPELERKSMVREAAVEILAQAIREFKEDVDVLTPSLVAVVRGAETLRNVELDSERSEAMRVLHREALLFVRNKCTALVLDLQKTFSDNAMIQEECQRFLDLMAEVDRRNSYIKETTADEPENFQSQSVDGDSKLENVSLGTDSEQSADRHEEGGQSVDETEKITDSSIATEAVSSAFLQSQEAPSHEDTHSHQSDSDLNAFDSSQVSPPNDSEKLIPRERSCLEGSGMKLTVVGRPVEQGCPQQFACTTDSEVVSEAGDVDGRVIDRDASALSPCSAKEIEGANDATDRQEVPSENQETSDSCVENRAENVDNQIAINILPVDQQLNLSEDFSQSNPSETTTSPSAEIVRPFVDPVSEVAPVVSVDVVEKSVDAHSVEDTSSSNVGTQNLEESTACPDSEGSPLVSRASTSREETLIVQNVEESEVSKTDNAIVSREDSLEKENVESVVSSQVEVPNTATSTDEISIIFPTDSALTEVVTGESDVRVNTTTQDLETIREIHLDALNNLANVESSNSQAANPPINEPAEKDSKSESSSASLDLACTRLQLRRTTYCVPQQTAASVPAPSPSTDSIKTNNSLSADSELSSPDCCESHELKALSDIEDDSLEKSVDDADSFNDCNSLDEDSYSLSDCCSEGHDTFDTMATMPTRSVSCPGLDKYYQSLEDDSTDETDDILDDDVIDGLRKNRRGWGSIHPPDVEGLLSNRTPSMVAECVEDAHKFRRLYLPPSQSEPDICSSLERRGWDPMPLNELLYLEEKSLESRSEVSSGTSQCSEADEEGIIDYLLSQPHGYIVQLLVSRTQVLLYVLSYWNRKRYLTVFDILGRPVLRVLEDVRLPAETADFARSRQTETVHTTFVSILNQITKIDCMTNKMKQKLLVASEKLLIQPLTPSLTVRVCSCTEELFRKWKQPDKKSIHSLMSTINKLHKDDDVDEAIQHRLNRLLAIVEQNCEK